MVKRDSGELFDLNGIEVVITTFLCKWAFKKIARKTWDDKIYISKFKVYFGVEVTFDNSP